MREIRVDGVRSPVAESGPQEDPSAVVFVHGNPGPKEDWQSLQEALGDDIRSVAPDMPGYGDADRPADFDYSVAGYAKHLDGLLGELGIQRAHLVLHDFGGPWGLAWAAEHQDRVGSITLINTGVFEGYRWHKFAKIWQTPVLGELFQLTGTRRMFKAALDADNPVPFPDAFVDRIWSKADWGHKRAVLRLYRASKDLKPLVEPLVRAFEDFHPPCLVVWGAGDRYLPARFADVQKKFFRVEAVHLLDGCGHWPFVDAPERVEALVVPFLRKHAGLDPQVVSSHQQA